MHDVTEEGTLTSKSVGNDFSTFQNKEMGPAIS